MSYWIEEDEDDEDSWAVKALNEKWIDRLKACRNRGGRRVTYVYQLYADDVYVTVLKNYPTINVSKFMTRYADDVDRVEVQWDEDDGAVQRCYYLNWDGKFKMREQRESRPARLEWWQHDGYDFVYLKATIDPKLGFGRIDEEVA